MVGSVKSSVPVQPWHHPGLPAFGKDSSGPGCSMLFSSPQETRCSTQYLSLSTTFKTIRAAAEGERIQILGTGRYLLFCFHGRRVNCAVSEGLRRTMNSLNMCSRKLFGLWIPRYFSELCFWRISEIGVLLFF